LLRRRQLTGCTAIMKEEKAFWKKKSGKEESPRKLEHTVVHPGKGSEGKIIQKWGDISKEGGIEITFNLQSDERKKKAYL